MSERFKEKITVSAEVKTYLKDLYHQIEYELREDYDDALEKALNKIDEAIEYLKEREEDNMCCSVCSVMSDKLLEILGDKDERA